MRLYFYDSFQFVSVLLTLLPLKSSQYNPGKNLVKRTALLQNDVPRLGTWDNECYPLATKLHQLPCPHEKYDVCDGCVHNPHAKVCHTPNVNRVLPIAVPPTGGLHDFDQFEARQCLKGKTIAFVGNSLSRGFQWALFEELHNYSLRRSNPKMQDYWGSSGHFFAESSCAGQEPCYWGPETWGTGGNYVSDVGVMLGLDGITLYSVMILDWTINTDPNHPDFFAQNLLRFQMKRLSLPEPDLIILQMGLRTLNKEEGMDTAPEKLEFITKGLLTEFPNIPLIYHTIPSSVDEKRRGGYADSQGEKYIRMLNSLTIPIMDKLNVPVFDVWGITRSALSEMTGDGIHFYAGTGIMESVARIFLNWIC